MASIRYERSDLPIIVQPQIYNVSVAPMLERRSLGTANKQMVNGRRRMQRSSVMQCDHGHLQTPEENPLESAKSKMNLLDYCTR